MTTTVQSIIGKDANAGDLTPLSRNDTFTAAANAELATIEDAAERAQVLAAKNENLTGTISTFSTAVGSLRAIGKRFPESAKFIDEAIKQTQLAMGVVKDNPVVSVTATNITPFQSPATGKVIPPPPPPPPAKERS
jgi:hypothetical protein